MAAAMHSQPQRPGLGEPIAWFRAPTLNGPDDYGVDGLGGRPLMMLFFGSAGHADLARAVAAAVARADLFDDARASFAGITVDPQDVAQGRIARTHMGMRWFLDYDRAVSRDFGAVDADGAYRPYWLVLDAHLRVIGSFALGQADAAFAALESAVAAVREDGWAPVALVPGVLEPDVCRMLIDLYRANGGDESGIMREVDGRTKLVLDSAFKVRRDYTIGDGHLGRQLIARISRRLAPMVKRCFQFEATNVERLLVGCYDEQDGGHFKAHRDDTTRGTAHRRFAVTINLNADEYDGGDLRFPEFGPRLYRAPTGGAIVFSCSLLHQVVPVTRGRRFALLPFLYDPAAAAIRDRNMHLVDTDPVRVAT